MNEKQIKAWWEEQFRRFDLKSHLLALAYDVYGIRTSTALVRRPCCAMVLR